MPSESGAMHLTEKASAPPDVLARILANGGDSQRYRRLAVALLNHFGSLDALTRAGTQALLDTSSLTGEQVALLMALGDLVRMIGTDGAQDRSPIINSSEALGDYVRAHVRPPSIGASLRLIMVDRTHRVVGDVGLPPGHGPSLIARTAVVEALRRGAAGVVLLRVQASARPDFPQEFGDILQQVAAALDRLEVRLLDIAVATPTQTNPLSMQVRARP